METSPSSATSPPSAQTPHHHGAPTSPPLSPNSPSSSPSTSIGRVVRLHFTCKAELPMGSFLRVTGSTLWAPSAVSAQDPMNAHHISEEETATSGFAGTNHGTIVEPPEEDHLGGGWHTASHQQLYASSIPLVTTPETYPVWRTQRPVVVVLHKRTSDAKHVVQHHYYRYLVVTPAAGVLPTSTVTTISASNISDAMSDDMDEEGPTSANTVPSGAASTSDDLDGATPVMMWEDPFNGIQRQAQRVAEASGLSIASVQHVHPTQGEVSKNLFNLPYRTLDIDVETGRPLFFEDAIDMRLDLWNNPDDESFRSYIIRETINKENRLKLQLSRSAASSAPTLDAMMTMERGVPLLSGYSSSNYPGSMTPPPNFGLNMTTTGAGGGGMQRIYFVCFHLPVVVVQSKATGIWRAAWSESLLAKTEGSQIVNCYQAHWVGTVTTHPPITNEQDKQEVRRVLADMQCTPIFIDAELRQKHYSGFCKQVLWPAFHNIDLLDLSRSGWLGMENHSQNNTTGASDESAWDQSRLDGWWKAYQEVNVIFANLMGTLLNPGDILWIHDYHLSLLPKLMDEWEFGKFQRRISKKVFFLHIPFPTSQIFRELECGEALLRGMLHADVLGFHAFDHARHFLNAAKRILGLNYESLVGGLIGVSFNGKTVVVTMSNVSIEPRMIDAALMLPSVQTAKEDLKKKHGHRIILGGIDIGQRLSGTSLKLLAFERLLHDYPTWQTRVVMVQRVLLQGSRKIDEARTTVELRHLVQRIQSKFGSAVIDYQEISGSSLPMDQRLALWKASDILINTPIREGLNHWPMEYIYARKEPEMPGVVITSEFSAVSSILNGALRVNPYDIQMTITTIDKALSMDMQEREGRRYRDIDFVSTSPSDKWVRNVLRDLKDAVAHQPSTGGTANSEGDSLVGTPLGGNATPLRKELIDSTSAFLARESSLAFMHMSARAVKQAYDNTSKRVIILDFNGTIVLKEPPGKYLKREILGTSGNKPPPEVLDALTVLCQDPKNTVYVVSGDSSENVLNALGHIPGLGLAVSNGARFCRPTAPGETNRTWFTFDLGVDWDAVKKVALPVLSKYTARSNGSFVKLTALSIGWSYYSCDPEWGSLQASHIVLELENELRAFDVRFVTLKGIVEIVPRKLNKGLIVKRVLREAQQQSTTGVDFVLCFGDDISDEKMFTSVFSFIAEMEDDASAFKPSPPVVTDDGKLVVDNDMMHHQASLAKIRDPMYSFTVAVGKKTSHASSFVNDAQEVANTLVVLADGTVPMGGVSISGSENAALFA